MTEHDGGAELPALLRASPLPSGVVDAAGRWVATNDALRALLGTTPPDLDELLDEPGLGASELLSDDVPLTVRVRLPSGADASAAVAGAVEGRRLVQLLDRSDLRRTEDLVAAAANATASFVSRVSHDLKNPIGTAQGYTELLLEDPTLTKESRGFVERIASSTRRALDTVSEIVSETRASAAVTTPDTVDLDEVVEAVRAELAGLIRDRGAEVTTSGQLPTLRADRADLRLALVALVQNAVAHHPGSAHIEVSATRTEEGWTLAVDDDGPGLAADQRDAALSGASGTAGFGFRLVRAAMTRSGGKLELDSSDRGGTRAQLVLPQRRMSDPYPD